MKPLDYAKMCCNTVMEDFPDGNLPPFNRFHYHAGVFLSGMEKTYLLCKEEEYNNYIKKWIDLHIDSEGSCKNIDFKTLDDLQPCTLLFRYNEERYRKVLDSLVPLLLEWPCNNSGGWWHKNCHPDQMWLDSLYMGSPLAVRYGILNNDYRFIDKAAKQLSLMRDNMTDKKTGLMYHAWDESKEESWADKNTGLSSEFWGRAIGWVLAASADISEILPDESPAKNEFLECVLKLLEAIIKFQDKETGMWYQVVDKGGNDGNWIETSCSCLYTYSLSNLIRRGYLTEYKNHLIKAYEGITGSAITVCNNKVIVKNVCIGTKVGDYDFYINRPTAHNDLHGAGAFILMCAEYSRLNF